MSTTVVIVGILLVAGLAVVAFLIGNANRGRRSYENVPPAMRPGYSDEQLERTVLERYMAWGVVLTGVLAVFLPLYWLNEPGRIQNASEGFFVTGVVRGEEEYQQLCARCHGPQLQGGAAASPYGTDPWPAPALNNIVVRYEDNRNIFDIRDFIIETLHRGRPGTPMPTWGAAFGGPLTDQQIEDITDYILSQQVDEVAQATPAADKSGEQLYVENCVKCHGANLRAEDGRPGVSLVGVFDRHSEETVLAILRNGIYVPTGAMMPPWQNGYMYVDKRFDDAALRKIMEYLASRQPPGDAGAPAEPGQTQSDEAGEAPTESPTDA